MRESSEGDALDTPVLTSHALEQPDQPVVPSFMHRISSPSHSWAA
ncbi:hypothetical protein [Sporisorium scitamineum]|uniref:Uncharacterized protein n=1 Tax=Sporisorium scitamineum TaxID=49012 RepID=A0A0F7S3K7_9BASI|nr:hypothetical protein [Sporisorium scitamineum]